MKDEIRELIRTFLINLSKGKDVKELVESSFALKGNLVDQEFIGMSELVEATVSNINFIKFYISNDLLSVKDNKAHHSFYLTIVSGISEESGFYPLIIGLKNIVSYQYDSKWKIKTIESNVDYVKGNTELLEKFNLKNGESFDRFGRYESVDVFLMTEAVTDKAMIRKSLYLLSLAIDNENASLASCVLAENCTLIINGEQKAKTKKDIIAYISEWNRKDSSNMHAIVVKDINIENEIAKVKAYRLQLDRIKSKSYNTATKLKIYYNTEIIFKLKKSDSWEINEIYADLKIIEESVSEEIDYYNLEFSETMELRS